jgi:tetratricopeptide (TPR) repeat protein
MLALKIAQQIKVRFPDGQLFIDLGGVADPRDPHKVLGQFLRAFGLRDGAIPLDRKERETLYRQILAPRQMLILLDNASEDKQVRPLLPNSSSCVVLATSRKRLIGLEGVHWYDLTAMKMAEARQFLRRVARDGGRRTRISEDSAEEVVELCGRLPLAVRIAGARISETASPTIEALLERLRNEQQTLHELQAGDLEIHAAFTLSYDALTEREKRAFHLLGILRARSGFGAWLAAAVLDNDLQQTEDVLQVLVNDGLLQHEGSRYRFHDLLGLYAYECLLKKEAHEVRRAALNRALAACVALSKRARGLLELGRVLTSGESSVERWVVHDPNIVEVIRRDPYAWYSEERAILATAVERAVEAEEWELAWELATTLPPFFGIRGYWRDWERVQGHAAAAAERLVDHRKKAATLLSLGDLFRQKGQLDEAFSSYNEARETYQRLGDLQGQAKSMRRIGALYRLQGKWREALKWLTGCLPIFQELNDRRSEALTLRHIGVALRNDGRWNDALDYFNRSLPIFQELSDHRSVAYTRRHIGVAYRNKGLWDQALDCYDQALPVFQALGDQRGEASVLTGRGDVYREQDLFAEAVDSLEEALLIRLRLGDDRMAAHTLRMIGVVYRLQGQPTAALPMFRKSLELFRRSHDRCWEAYALVNLGEAYGDLEQWDQALSHLDKSMALLRELENSLWVAKALKSRGELLMKAPSGNGKVAITDWQEALDIFRGLGAPEAAQVEELLRPLL